MHTQIHSCLAIFPLFYSTRLPQLQGHWGTFLKQALALNCEITRLSANRHGGYLPKFSPGDDDVLIKVLAPIDFENSHGQPIVPAFRRSPSQNTSGNSLLIKVEYGKPRTLLTGALKNRSMQALLQDLPEASELACDGSKGCHHGSDDLSWDFLQSMGATATIISSGDSQSHAHPRPSFVAASAVTGHVQVKDDELLTPLIYSTEISSSVCMGKIISVQHNEGSQAGAGLHVTITPDKKASINYQVAKAGALNPKKKSRRYHPETRMVYKIIYGLVNVRTDGDKILRATLNESNSKWDI